MNPDADLPAELVRQVDAFADDQGIPDDHAYELLVTVGLEALEGVPMDVYSVDGELVLECDRCDVIFDAPAELIEHDDRHH